MFGFLNVNKPAGPTSHDIVAQIRRLLPRKTKVGHAGTLDPFAEGVLVVCIGPATRLASYVQNYPKRYRACITLGSTSTTDDIEGKITAVSAPEIPNCQQVENALRKFVGQISQIPPAHSAVHVNGQRAYKLARTGQELSIAPRKVNIHSVELVRYEYPLLEIDVRCSQGTYIRSLARDIGNELGTGGYCNHLWRTEIGSFRIDEAAKPHLIDLGRDIIPPLAALTKMPKLTVDDKLLEDIARGKSIPLDELETEQSGTTATELALLDRTGRLAALAKSDADSGQIRPTKVFISPGCKRN